MRNYHVTLHDGTERNIRAMALRVTDSGALLLLSDDGEPIVGYAPGTWAMVEIERLDDK